LYGTGTARRQEGAKTDAAKRKRDAGPDILNPQIQALGAMDEALDADSTAKLDIKGLPRVDFASLQKAVALAQPTATPEYIQKYETYHTSRNA